MTTLGAVSTGICSVDGAGVHDGARLPAGGTCSSRPRCVLDLGTRCHRTGSTGCDAGEFCVPDGARRGDLSREARGLLHRCGLRRAGPLPRRGAGGPAGGRPAEPSSGGGLVFVGAGRCNEDLRIACTRSTRNAPPGTPVGRANSARLQLPAPTAPAKATATARPAPPAGATSSCRSPPTATAMRSPIRSTTAPGRQRRAGRPRRRRRRRCVRGRAPTATPVPAPPHAAGDDAAPSRAPTHASKWMPLTLPSRCCSPCGARSRPRAAHANATEPQ